MKTQQTNLYKIKEMYKSLNTLYKMSIIEENIDKKTVEFEKKLDNCKDWIEENRFMESKEYSNYVKYITKTYKTHSKFLELKKIEDIIINIGLKFFKEVRPEIVKDIKGCLHLIDIRNKLINLTLRSPLFNN